MLARLLPLLGYMLRKVDTIGEETPDLHVALAIHSIEKEVPSRSAGLGNAVETKARKNVRALLTDEWKLLKIAIRSPDEINVLALLLSAPTCTRELTRVFDIACGEWGEDDLNHVCSKLLAE
jgi:hypothetical protein